MDASFFSGREGRGGGELEIDLRERAEQERGGKETTVLLAQKNSRHSTFLPTFSSLLFSSLLFSSLLFSPHPIPSPQPPNPKNRPTDYTEPKKPPSCFL